jgi:hypothetical protein
MPRQPNPADMQARCALEHPEPIGRSSRFRPITLALITSGWYARRVWCGTMIRSQGPKPDAVLRCLGGAGMIASPPPRPPLAQVGTSPRCQASCCQGFLSKPS